MLVWIMDEFTHCYSNEKFEKLIFNEYSVRVASNQALPLRVIIVRGGGVPGSRLVYVYNVSCLTDSTAVECLFLSVLV